MRDCSWRALNHEIEALIVERAVIDDIALIACLRAEFLKAPTRGYDRLGKTGNRVGIRSE